VQTKLVLQSALSKTDTKLSVRLIESQIKGVKKGRDQLKESVLQRCTFYRESNKGSQERQGPTQGVRLIESQIKGVKKRQRPTLVVRFTEVSVLQSCPLKDS